MRINSLPYTQNHPKEESNGVRTHDKCTNNGWHYVGQCILYWVGKLRAYADVNFESVVVLVNILVQVLVMYRAMNPIKQGIVESNKNDKIPQDSDGIRGWS